MKNLILILFLLLIGLSLSSQTNVVKERELQVEKNYNNEIYAVHPVFDFANISIPSRNTVNIGLESMAGAPSFAPDLDVEVKPLAYQANLPKTGHKGMLKFDKGTINPWHVQGGYVYSAANHFTIHATGEYDNWAQSLISDQNIMKAKGNIGSTYYITSDLKTTIDINYSNQRYGLYAGQKANDNALNNTNHFNSIGVDLGIQTFRTLPSKWNMGLDIEAIKWNERSTDNNEYNIQVATYLQYKASSSLTLKTTPTYNLSRSEAFETAYFFNNTLEGQLDYKSSNLTMGLSTAYYNDNFRLWPSTDIKWNISASDELKLSSKQDITINSAGHISNYNPYGDLNSLTVLNDNNDFFKDIYVDRNAIISFKNTHVKDIELNASTSYHLIENDQNFTLIENTQRFNLERVDFNVLKMQLGGSYAMLEKAVNIGVSVQYNKYIDPSEVLLHRPEWEIKPKVASRFINDRLHLELSSNINSPQVLSLENSVEVKSSWRTNISFEARYELLSRLNIYLNADNIIDDEYQVWNGYNNFGRNLSAGILIKI